SEDFINSRSLLKKYSAATIRWPRRPFRGRGLVRVAELEKDVSQMKKIDHSTEALAALKSQVPTVVEYYLRSKIGHDLQKSTDMVTLKDCDQKSALYQTIHENKSLNRNPANHALHYALMEDLIEDENAMDKGVANIVNNHKRQHDDDDDDDEDEDLLAGLNQGKKTNRRRTKESESSKKPSTTKETYKGKASSKSSKSDGPSYLSNLSRTCLHPIQRNMH
nr:hypothetical protein [Tanacetum cinerariifolium]